MDKAKVYFTKEITPESVIKITLKMYLYFLSVANIHEPNIANKIPNGIVPTSTNKSPSAVQKLKTIINDTTPINIL